MKTDAQFSKLPSKIVDTVMSDYLFSDIFTKFKRFFTKPLIQDKRFLCLFALGLMPRKFDSTDPVDRIIYEEDQEIAEMLFILEGKVGIAINQYS